jgi:hypothetical protein
LITPFFQFTLNYVDVNDHDGWGVESGMEYSSDTVFTLHHKKEEGSSENPQDNNEGDNPLTSASREKFVRTIFTGTFNIILINYGSVTENALDQYRRKMLQVKK